MKSIIIALFTLMLSLSAFASHDLPPVPAPPEPTPVQPVIFGDWASDEPIYGSQTWIWTRFTFTPRKMIMHATCEFRYPQNIHLTVGVSSRVSYSNRTILIREKSEGSVNDGYRYCNAGIAPSTWEYYFSSPDFNHMVIIAPVPWQMRFHVSRVAE